MLLELLQDAGYRGELSAKSRYMKGLLPLLGGQFALDILKHPDILRLFSNAQIRKGTSYTLSQLAQIAVPGAGHERFLGQMKTLAGSGTLIRGYRLQCPTCDLDTWYPLDVVGERVTCEGCRIPFQLPLALDFAFRPNRLLIEALKSGALTVLLTLNHWLHDYPVTVWQSNIDIQQEAMSTDIDLLVQREDGLYMAECKDNFDDSLAGIRDVEAQLAIGKDIAKDIGATFVFATLYDAPLPTTLQNYLDKHEIVTLTRDDLLSVG
ncbi:MAG: hypothetical protein AAFR81_28490 [Chloroflexota bacterium]